MWDYANENAHHSALDKYIDLHACGPEQIPHNTVFFMSLMMKLFRKWTRKGGDSCQNALSTREHVDVVFELLTILGRYFTRVFSGYQFGHKSVGIYLLLAIDQVIGENNL